MADEKNDAQESLASLPIKVGQQFKHFKGGLYEIIGVAIKEDTLEPLVIYKSKVTNYLWIRTVPNFTEHVDRDGYSGPRFVLLS